MKNYINQRLSSFKYAINGLKFGLKESNLKIHLIITVLVVLFGLIKDISEKEWYILLICIGFVLVAELFNTAIEKVVDYISLDQHPEAKVIKDLSAAAVLISAIISAIIGFWILFIRN